MQNSTPPIKLLILDPSRNEAEERVNLLRNAGRATQAQFIESEEQLLTLLNSKSWDLLFASDQVNTLTPAQALAHIKKLEQDIPLIVLASEYNGESVLAQLNAGACDVVPVDETERLLLVSLRELDNLAQRRARRKAEISLRDAEKRCRLLLDSSKDAIAYVHDGMHIYANPAYVELFGYTSFDDLEGLPLMDMVAPQHQAELKALLRKQQVEGEQPQTFSCKARRENETDFDTTLQFSPARYDGENCTQILIRTAAGEAAPSTPQRDVLTGLQTAAAFQDAVHQAIKAASEHQKKATIFYIQLDNFVPLKNRLGAAATNLVLGDIAKSLRQNALNPQQLARIDEYNFAFIAPDIEPEAALAHGEKLCQAITANPCNVSDEGIEITASIGIALINENTDDPGEVITKASEAAAFVRHNQNGDGVHLHDSNEQNQAHNQQISQLLHQALDKSLFRLVFQPIVSLRGDSGEHYEVLLRMPDEDGNEICPSEFLQTASNIGLTRDIDFWVIQQSIARLQAHLGKSRQSHLLINITRESLLDASLLPRIGALLNEARIPGDSIIFQISETDATAHLKEAKTFISGINELQCKAAITHFGRALNPFNTLKHLPVSYVKIDGSFIHELSRDEDSKEDLKTLVSSLHTQGKLTIAPMVDSASLLPILWQAGINYIQGYYIQQPSGDMDYDFSSEDEEDEDEVVYQ